MDILPVNFCVLRFCGAWDEQEESNIIFWILKKIYRFAVVALIFHFTIFEVIALFLSHGDFDDIVDGLVLTLTFVALCVKFANFLLRQQELSLILDCFRTKTCRSKNANEEIILQKYKRKAKFCVLSFMTLSQMTGLALSFYPVLEPFYEERILPMKMYVPYSLSNPWIYFATYLMQFLSMTYGVFLNVSFDSLVYGLTIHTCGQIELLCHRIQTFEDKELVSGDPFQTNGPKNNLIGFFVEHHIHIHQLVKKIQSMFVLTVTILFCFSLITLCTSIFQMSKKSVASLEFLSLILYLGSMLIQTFFYCWYGNELELKSKMIADAVYCSDWILTTPRTRKSLLSVMLLSRRGMRINFHGIFGLALPTFTWIVKTSYSAFSVLQNMSL